MKEKKKKQKKKIALNVTEIFEEFFYYNFKNQEILCELKQISEEKKTEHNKTKKKKKTLVKSFCYFKINND